MSAPQLFPNSRHSSIAPEGSRIGLRIDVDTLRGTRLGVPQLVATLKNHGILASFFFSVGPDNMGRHLWRLLKPAFFLKMLRTKAASLYGLDILLKGTFWPGPLIGKKCAGQIRQAAAAGHEIGLHAWDHHGWQNTIEKMSRQRIQRDLKKGYDLLTAIVGTPPTCAAAPAWRITEEALYARESFPFQYLSDCRGTSIFRPRLNGKPLRLPQIPATLPTYDEVIGRGVDNDTYNSFLLQNIRPDALNVLTIHAEVEGICCHHLFSKFLDEADRLRLQFCPLGGLLPDEVASGRIEKRTLPGREGWISCQSGQNDDHG